MFDAYHYRGLPLRRHGARVNPGGRRNLATSPRIGIGQGLAAMPGRS